jgi:hypothetical protein
MGDPTYNRDEIDANPMWKLAWLISEIENDNAPIGWGQYVYLAKVLMSKYEIRERAAPEGTEGDEP